MDGLSSRAERHVAPAGNWWREGDDGYRVQRPAPDVPAEMPEPEVFSANSDLFSRFLSRGRVSGRLSEAPPVQAPSTEHHPAIGAAVRTNGRSEEHTSELQ